MKKVKALILGFIMAVSLIGVVYNAANDNKEATAKCMIVWVVAAVVMPSSKTASFGFLNKSYFTQDQNPYARAELALIQHLATNGKGQTKDDAVQGKLKLETYARGFRFVIPNAFGGRRELLNAASQFIQGAIPEEFNLGQLPDGYNVAVSHARIGFVADAVITTGQAGVAYGTQPNAWPAALRNGQIVISQAGAIKSFFDTVTTGTMAASFGKIGEDDALEFQAPFILEENKATKFELITAANQAFASPAGGNLLEIILFGAMVRLRA